MPGKSLKCVVEVKLASISCPGVWLNSKNDLRLNISMFGQHYQTKRLGCYFPLLIFQTFNFEKIFESCFDPADLTICLEREPVYIELVQLEPLQQVIISIFQTVARKFLYPVPTLRPSYGGSRYDILFKNTQAFPSELQPRLGYSTSTIIYESRFDYTHPKKFLEGELKARTKSAHTLSASVGDLRKLYSANQNNYYHDLECTVCNLYKEYFGRNYSGHKHVGNIGNCNWYSHNPFFHSTLRAQNRDDMPLCTRSIALKDKISNYKDQDQDSDQSKISSNSESLHEIWSPKFEKNNFFSKKEKGMRYQFNKRQLDMIKALSTESLYN